MAYTDNDIMPFGKYKGRKMANVPAKYLIYIYDENKCNNKVREYIEDNLDALKSEIEFEKKVVAANRLSNILQEHQ